MSTSSKIEAIFCLLLFYCLSFSETGWFQPKLKTIHPISNEIPYEYKLYQNYPNPFNPKSKVKFSIEIPSGQIAKFSETKLVVFDILSKCNLWLMKNYQLVHMKLNGLPAEAAAQAGMQLIMQAVCIIINSWPITIPKPEKLF